MNRLFSSAVLTAYASASFHRSAEPQNLQSAVHVQDGDCYDTSETAIGYQGSGSDCVVACADGGYGYVANWNVSSGNCYCEHMDMGDVCYDYGSENYYEMWAIVDGSGDLNAEFVRMGDCYDTSESYIGSADSGDACLWECYDQGYGYTINWHNSSGSCYCEYMGLGDECDDYGSSYYYEMWSLTEGSGLNAYYVRGGDCYDTSEAAIGWQESGEACVLTCAGDGYGFTSNWNISSGNCYCEYMEEGQRCDSYGSENYYELWTASYAAPHYMHGGDCYDTSEVGIGYVESGDWCALTCAYEGIGFSANWSISSGNCYCEYMEMGQTCSDYGSTDSYEFWSVY